MSLPVTTRIAKCRAAFPLAAALLLGPALQAAPRHAAAGMTRMVTDETGRRIEIPVHVRRVVSLAPNDTGILYSLGAGAKIAGVTDFTTTPPGQTPKPSVGEPLEPSLERIVALKPDLVLAAQTINRVETVESLEKLGIPVYVTAAYSVEGMLRSVRRVADLIGMAAVGEKLTARLEKRLLALRARLAGRPVKSVLFVVWENPLITTGEHTFIADALRRAGARPVVHLRQDWPQISLEEVVNLQPDYLIFPATGGAPGNISQALGKRAGWRDLKAVRDGHVIVVNSAIDRPCPQLVGAIEQLARQLHPAAFSSSPSAAEQSRTMARTMARTIAARADGR